MYKIVLIGIFLSGCSSFYYYPHKKTYITPDKMNLSYQESSISSRSQSKLNTWLVKNNKNSKSKYLIIQFHGNAENISTHFTSLAWLTQHSFDLLTFDYSGYGKSTGSPKPMTLRQDALSFLNHALDLYKAGSYERLIVYAQSLGGAVAMDAIELWENRDKIDLLVLDSTFTSYKRVGFKVLQKSWLTYLFSPLAYVVLTNETAPTGRLSELKMPKLVIHSKNDPVVDFKEGEHLFKNLPDPKEFWPLQSPGHVAVFFIKKNQFREKFLNFVQNI